ncbi:MAG: hypothetical protein J1E04_06390, partial [Alistipes sp.]|nr:hypothetical protein [Alistipes sp.]
MKKLLFTFMLFSAFSLAGCNDKNAGIDDINDNAQTETPDNDNNTDNGDGKDVEDDEYFPYTTEEMFPDPIFRTYVLNRFDIDGDGKISKEEAEAVTSIDVRKDVSTPDDERIASLEGIQFFT